MVVGSPKYYLSFNLRHRRAGRWWSYVLIIMLWMMSLSARGSVTIEQAITLAFRTHPDLKAAYHQYHISEERYAEARAGLFPTVDISATYGNGKQDVPESRIGTQNESTLPVTYNITFEQLLFDGFFSVSNLHRNEREVRFQY